MAQGRRDLQDDSFSFILKPSDIMHCSRTENAGLLSVFSSSAVDSLWVGCLMITISLQLNAVIWKRKCWEN